MFMKNFLSINICLTLVTFQRILSKFFDDVNKKVIGKVKENESENSKKGGGDGKIAEG